MREGGLKVGIVAGEASGDILGASLIEALRKQYPQLQVEGIGGPRMIVAGCHSLFAMDRLSVMGLIEPLKRLPELLQIRRTLKQHFVEHRPDVFIGIDSPDFTLNIERYLKQQGIKTVHYVSPSVWAWRQGRIHGIKQSVDLMLTLFPFEQTIYEQHGIRVSFVGHPLADEFPLEIDTAVYRRALGIATDKTCVALLPGSREAEVKLMAPVFLETAERCWQQKPGLQFLLPAANAARYRQLQRLLQGSKLPITLYEGRSHEVMGASDVVLMASGTTTLEAMLLKKPMVVAYKMAPLSHAIISRLLKTPFVALPNLLAQKMLVPERLQAQATAVQLAQDLMMALQDKKHRDQLQKEFAVLHEQLRCGAGDRAAKAIGELLHVA